MRLRGHVCLRMSLILIASLGLAQKLPQLESRLRSCSLILLTTKGRFPGKVRRGQRESEALREHPPLEPQALSFSPCFCDQISDQKPRARGRLTFIVACSQCQGAKAWWRHDAVPKQRGDRKWGKTLKCQGSVPGIQFLQ